MKDFSLLQPISHGHHANLQSHTLKDFKLDRVLGTGSFGRVSLARHIATGRICAIKALSKANVVKNQQVWCFHIVYCPAKSSARIGVECMMHQISCIKPGVTLKQSSCLMLNSSLLTAG